MAQRDDETTGSVQPAGAGCVACVEDAGAAVYEQREITHVLTWRATRVVVEGVPARICIQCGHPRIDDATLAAVERLVRARHRPARPRRRPLQFGTHA